jgi:acyl-coenzyme A synthetase/AMP-(fatty) acid ligase
MGGLSLQLELERALALFADRRAVVCESERPTRALSYAQLGELVARARPLLRAIGVGPGQVVPIQAGRTPEAIAFALAATLEGAAFCFVPTQWRVRQLLAVQRLAEPACLLVDDASMAALRRAGSEDVAALRPLLLGDAPAERQAGREHSRGAACVLFTSGSTGAAKGVLIAPDDLLARARTEIESFGMGAGDGLLCLLPWSFDVGLNQLVSGLLAGASLHLTDAWLRLDLAAVVERAPIAGISAVPSIWSTALAGLPDGERLLGPARSLRWVTVSGGSLAAAPFQRLAESLGPEVAIHRTYGQTETFRSTLNWRALPGVTVAIARNEEELAAPGETGEVVHAGVGTMLGYLGDEAGTRGKLRPHARLGTVVYTGDEGVLDADGHLHLSGRRDHMIKSNGVRLYPAEIEACLLEHEGVREAVVFGVPDPAAGERIAAVVLARPGLAGDQLKRFVAERLPSNLVPRAIAIWSELPRTASGKPALEEIRRGFLDGD